MISIRSVSKSYGNKKVLDNINLEIPESQIYALIGPSGAGKSTLIRSLNSLETIQEGEILVNGVSVHAKETNINQLRTNIGFVFQSFNLYPHLTALQNVTYAPIHVKKIASQEAETRGKELLASLGLEEKYNEYPGQLSGGQQQRVAIARALAMEPKIMLFDEPTSALDPEMIKEVLDSIRKLASTGMTMVVVTHEMGFAREICNKIVFMADGKIVETASPEKFFTAPDSDRAKDFLAKVINH
ncbi:amino acid ABC transporter ATP-binding protein [Bacillus sp. S/N-304-OC-R1]|uniref:amino acid ABC transporter ATP-binding protein n=1 Tax=Bacillus sp. S/N-304-OC-R1 TaxID=2758034 RepID=UPI001C8D8F3B|nr:amino acid ABC transporter ATP-binding protein [Bacillus sp. S/N-304-OC-R1]MBY0122917.1 amino acid ABC transporter ATP-binding protein [Bacillus sp. S/N-304-OC-R1]